MTHPVVLGLGGTVDFELHWSDATLRSLAAEYRVRLDELDGSSSYRAIRAERDLVVSVLDHLRLGDGGEHFVAESMLLTAFAERFGYTVTLGGTGVRAGLAALMHGVESTQHLVSIDDHVRRLLPPSMDVLCSSHSDTLDPHLIVQYPAGARVELDGTTIESPRANRLIYVNDPPNRQLVLSDRLPDALRGASLFLVSGFNSMQERDLLEERVAQLREAMEALPTDAVVVFEDAGYHEPSHGRVVLEALADRFDVYGLNEDELQVRIGRPVDLLDATDVARAMVELAALVAVPALVLHTQRYALVASDDPEHWMGALDGGVVMSGARYAWGDAVTPDRLEQLRRTGTRSRDGAVLVSALAGASPRIRGVAAFELEVEHPTTIGLGDSFVGGFVATLERERRARARSTGS